MDSRAERGIGETIGGTHFRMGPRLDFKTNPQVVSRQIGAQKAPNPPLVVYRLGSPNIWGGMPPLAAPLCSATFAAATWACVDCLDGGTSAAPD